MDPIATYSEVRFDGKRTFMLFPDRIYIRGKWTLKSDFEIDFPLVSLDTNYYRMNIRNGAFMAGIWMAVVSFVTCTILVSGFKMTFADNAPFLVAAIGFSGLVLSAATYRKIEFLCFRSRGGGKVFDIARSGKQAEQLDLFIDALTKQIKLATEAA
jgi:hypothetical protein